MDQRIFIIRLNLEHYRELLAAEIDDAKRQNLLPCWRKKKLSY
jgi:hypothetical protein